jgi:hypothetical protein
MKIALVLFLLLGAPLAARPAGPTPSVLKRDEVILFYPSCAWLDKDSDGRKYWCLPVHFEVYEREMRTLAIKMIHPLLGLHDDELTAEERETYKERLRLFMVDNQRGKKIPIQIAGTNLLCPATHENGHHTNIFALPAEAVVAHALGSTTRYLAVRMRGEDAKPAHLEKPTDQVNILAGPTFSGKVYLLESEGVSVISDIDDTIKISNVLDRKELLKNTFARPFKPVPGMAVRYRQWQTNGAFLHYVSASPWQLYLPLVDFLEASGFPPGVLELKYWRLKDRTAFSLLADPIKYKTQVITSLLKRYPRRQFILVGDSGEKDPEVYGDIGRSFAPQIKAIYIRDVTGNPADSLRYQTAFREISQDKWRLFKEAHELPERVGDR